MDNYFYPYEPVRLNGEQCDLFLSFEAASVLWWGATQSTVLVWAAFMLSWNDLRRLVKVLNSLASFSLFCLAASSDGLFELVSNLWRSTSRVLQTKENTVWRLLQESGWTHCCTDGPCFWGVCVYLKCLLNNCVFMKVNLQTGCDMKPSLLRAIVEHVSDVGFILTKCNRHDGVCCM